MATKSKKSFSIDDLKRLTPEQKEAFLTGFRRYIGSSKRFSMSASDKKDVMEVARGYLGLSEMPDATDLNVVQDYMMGYVRDIYSKRQARNAATASGSATSKATAETKSAAASKSAGTSTTGTKPTAASAAPAVDVEFEKFKRYVKGDTADELWDRLSLNAQARVQMLLDGGKSRPAGSTGASGLSSAGMTDEEKAARLKAAKELAKTMVDKFRPGDFADRTSPTRFEKFKDSLADVDAEEIYSRLSTSTKAKVLSRLDAGRKRPAGSTGASGLASADMTEEEKAKRQADLHNMAKEMFENDEFDPQDFVDLTPYVAPEDEKTKGKTPTSTPSTSDPRGRPSLPPYMQEIVDANEPKRKSARNRGIIEAIAGAAALILGADLAVSTFAVIPAAAAVTGVLLPVVGLAAVGGALAYTATANAVKAFRYSRLREHMHRAYARQNAIGLPLNQKQVEKSIYKARKLCNKLGINYNHIPELNDGVVLEEYRSVGQRVGARGRNVGRWVTSQATYGKDRLDARHEARTEMKEQNKISKEAGKAFKDDTRLRAKRGYGIDPKAYADARKQRDDAAKEKQAIRARKADAVEASKDAKTARKADRTLDTMSIRRRNEMEQAYKNTMSDAELSAYIAMSDAEKQAALGRYVLEQKRANSLRTKIKGAVTRSHSSTATSSKSGPTMTRP